MLIELSGRILHKLAFVGPFGYSFRPWCHKRRGVNIGNNVWIAQYVYIDELHPDVVTIGDNSTIGHRTSIFTHFYWGPKRVDSGFAEVIIEKNVFVGPHCVIMPNVRIGEGAVIKAGTVVTRNVPPFTFWGPPPAGPLGQVTVPLTPDYSHEEFLKGLKPIRKRTR